MPDFTAFRQLDQMDTPPIVVPPTELVTTVLGVAMGDHTSAPALIAVRLHSTCIQLADAMFGEAAIFETHYTALGAERMTSGMSYYGVAKRANILARRLYDRDSRGDYHILVDSSGVGKPVVRAIRDSILPHVCVTGVDIVSGDKGDDSILWRSEAKIGLHYLISRLQAIFQGGRLHLPKEDIFEALLHQIRTYDSGVNGGPDLVRALALTCSSEYAPVRYDIGFDTLPTARL